MKMLEAIYLTPVLSVISFVIVAVLLYVYILGIIYKKKLKKDWKKLKKIYKFMKTKKQLAK